MLDPMDSLLEKEAAILVSEVPLPTHPSKSLRRHCAPSKYMSHEESKIAYTGLNIHEVEVPPPVLHRSSSNRTRKIFGTDGTFLNRFVPGRSCKDAVVHPRGKRSLFLPRTTLLLLGPLLVTAAYAFIAKFYLWQEAENGVVPDRPVNARAIFYAWLILSIFVLDWTKSALAGFEAAVLLSETKASDADQERIKKKLLIWHADHGWGAFSTWGKAVVTLGKYIMKKPWRGSKVVYEGPGIFWWYLASMTFFFTAIVPLSGLSMNPTDAVAPSRQLITITGPHRTTFDIMTSNYAAEQASNRWRTKTVTAPDEPTIFYAPEEMTNVSTTWFEDEIQADFASRTDVPIASRSRMTNRTVTFFSAPAVTERAYGMAWGLLTTLSCMPVHPYKDLRLLKVTGINNWTSHSIVDSDHYASGALPGLDPVYNSEGREFGVSWKYIIATTGQVATVFPEYRTSLPLNGTVELVLWQGYDNQSLSDSTFDRMSDHPFVVKSTLGNNSSTTLYHGFGIRCEITSRVGTALLSGSKRTYSDFQAQPSLPVYSTRRLSSPPAERPGILSIHSLVFEAFTTLTPGVQGVPKCQFPSVLCSPWMGANRATGGGPTIGPLQRTSSNSSIGGTMKYPTIDPERMNLAMYKLFGETAIVVMAYSPGSWTAIPNAMGLASEAGLRGFQITSDLTPGSVPPVFILVMLCVWALAMVLPPLAFGMLWTKREFEILDGDLLWRLGIENGQK